MSMPNDTRDDDRAPDEIDLLLPWHAVERLSPEEAERVEAALAREPARARHLDIVREEWTETVALNQDLGLPSRRAREALFARIAAAGDRATAGQPVRSDSLAQRFTAFLRSLSPQTLAWSGAAAAVVIALQAGFLATAYRAQQAPAGYETASRPEAPAAQAGVFVLVAFAPAATAAQIDALLHETQAAIVDGPRAGGLYRLRLMGRVAEEPIVTAAIARLHSQPGVVRLVIPERPTPKP